MSLFRYQRFVKPSKNTVCQVTIYLAIVLLMANLNGLVDYFLHPEIPYFDEEHLLVGGVTALVSSVLFGMLLIYLRKLNKALSIIKKLEKFLPICAYCKKIQKPDSDSYQNDSWEEIESYISKRTTCMFSHSICPECLHKHYPQFMESFTKENEVA